LSSRIGRGQIVAEQLVDASHPVAQGVTVDAQLCRGGLHLPVVAQKSRQGRDEVLVVTGQRIQYRCQET